MTYFGNTHKLTIYALIIYIVQMKLIEKRDMPKVNPPSRIDAM